MSSSLTNIMISSPDPFFGDLYTAYRYSGTVDPVGIVSWTPGSSVFVFEINGHRLQEETLYKGRKARISGGSGAGNPARPVYMVDSCCDVPDDERSYTNVGFCWGEETGLTIPYPLYATVKAYADAGATGWYAFLAGRTLSVSLWPTGGLISEPGGNYQGFFADFITWNYSEAGVSYRAYLRFWLSCEVTVGEFSFNYSIVRQHLDGPFAGTYEVLNTSGDYYARHTTSTLGTDYITGVNSFWNPASTIVDEYTID